MNLIKFVGISSMLLFSSSLRTSESSEVTDIPIHVENGEEDYETCLFANGKKHNYMYLLQAEEGRKSYGLTYQEVLNVLFGNTGIRWLPVPSSSMVLYSGFNSRTQEPVHIISNEPKTLVYFFATQESVTRIVKKIVPIEHKQEIK